MELEFRSSNMYINLKWRRGIYIIMKKTMRIEKFTEFSCLKGQNDQVDPPDR
jgi:hypothetical protein